MKNPDFLRNCDSNQKIGNQSQLSYYVELFDQYDKAASIIFNKEYEDFIDQILSRLKS